MTEVVDERLNDEQTGTRARCEAETTVGGTDYRCSLDDGHEEACAFVPVDEPDATQEGDDVTEPEESIGAAGKRQAEPASDQLMEKIGKQLDNEATRHSKRVAEIMGAEMETLATCPLCVTPGFVLSQAPPDFDPDQRAAVMTAMGEGGDGTYNTHPDLVTCELCNGLGHLLTGARNEANYVVSCPECISKGYINVKEKAAQDQAIRDATAYQSMPVQVVTAPAVANGPGAADPTNQPQPWFDYATNQWKL